MRLSVTLLDSFNSYLNGDINESQLIDRFSRDYKGNYYTERGSAFHKAIENNSNKEGNFKFLKLERVIKEIEFYKQRGIAELKNTKHYFIDGEDIELVGKADYWTPSSICELKTTTFFNPNTYLNSIQWKCYMAIFDVKEVVYIVAILDMDNAVKEVNTFTFLYYDEINAEIKELLSLFINYSKSMGLYEYLASSN